MFVFSIGPILIMPAHAHDRAIATWPKSAAPLLCPTAGGAGARGGGGYMHLVLGGKPRSVIAHGVPTSRIRVRIAFEGGARGDRGMGDGGHVTATGAVW